MAHFARIDENNIVQEIHVINNSVLDAEGEFPDSEASGQEFQASLGIDGVWLQCSYNANFRGNYPGHGFTYDSDLDAFIAPQPFPSWVLNDAFQWEAPIPYPSKGDWVWQEQSGAWVKA